MIFFIIWLVGFFISLLSIRYTLIHDDYDEATIVFRAVLTFIPVVNIVVGLIIFIVSYIDINGIDVAEDICNIIKKCLFVKDDKEKEEI